MSERSRKPAGAASIELCHLPRSLSPSQMFPHELADPTKIHRKMLPVYLNWLAVARMPVHAAYAFERVGYSKEFENAWNKAVNVCVIERDIESLKQLIEVRRPHGYDEKDDPALRLLLMEDGKHYGNYVKRLRIAPDILRQRLGDYRLLFRIGPEHVEVIDLVPRQDFERRIKTLSVSAGS